MTKPNKNWITDWEIGENPDREKELGNALIEIFHEFWEAIDLNNKSKSTRNRYSAALHTLGGYLIEQGVSKETEMTALKLLQENISQYDSVLIHRNNEGWQKELDMVSRSLYRYLNK
jgi:hypothetical protein